MSRPEISVPEGESDTPDSPLRSLRIEAFNYPLPQERIALYPLSRRDASKLLVYRTDTAPTGSANDDIEEKITVSTFGHVTDYLPKPSLLVFNDTRVVRARLIFFKKPVAGQAAAADPARIEIFCLEPTEPADISMAFSSRGKCRFKCLVGNNKRWKNGSLEMPFPLLGDESPDPAEGILSAVKVGMSNESFEIEFSWEPAGLSFAEVLEQAGKVPLPPYIHRQAEDSDTERYQTVFARYNGSVAAPTAGLHFTPEIIESLPAQNIDRAFITLHVGAGTFKPVKAEQIGEHPMHYEHISANRNLVDKLSEAIENRIPIIPVGTTSMRSLESLYWIGVRLTKNPDLHPEEFEVNQWDPYETLAKAQTEISAAESLQAVLAYMDRHQTNEIHGHTALMIAPGYTFAFCRGIITNFHQPQSTLLLLVSALIGPNWRKIYDYALKNDFRFLSYGDSCLFLEV